MKRQPILILAIVIAALLLTGYAGQASEGSTRTDFYVTEYLCGVGIEKTWIEGNVMHIRGYEHINVDVSTTPEVNGLNTTLADADINLKTGYANIRGTFDIQPEGTDGTWIGTWVFNGTPGSSGYVRAVGRGTGELTGKSIFFKVYDAPPDPATNAALCAGIGEPEGVEYIEGYILETGQ